MEYWIQQSRQSIAEGCRLGGGGGGGRRLDRPRRVIPAQFGNGRGPWSAVRIHSIAHCGDDSVAIYVAASYICDLYVYTRHRAWARVSSCSDASLKSINIMFVGSVTMRSAGERSSRSSPQSSFVPTIFPRQHIALGNTVVDLIKTCPTLSCSLDLHR